MSMWHGQKVEEVDVEQASAGSEHNVLLDVRNADEWDAGHAPNATWVPLDQLESARFQLPFNRTIVCVCRSGARSAKAAVELTQMGFRAANMRGGMKDWAARGLPVVREDGTPGEVI
jgi:rhodanese-related sulfurtransferase